MSKLFSLGKDLSASAQFGEGTERTKRITHKPDYFFTYGSGMGLCCIAAEYGIQHGINSGMEGKKCIKHHAGFVDNEYTKPYNHAQHKAVIERQKPTYATVRDIMPENLCLSMGVQFYEPQQIIDWGYELKEHAHEIILIPKSLEYLELIPDDFMIGFPMPSGYGGDEEEDLTIPPEAYRGRRLHLLGGSWARQLSYWYYFGDDVVSMDGNYIAKIAMMRQFVDPAGQVRSLGEHIPYQLDNVLHVVFALSCSAIATGLTQVSKC